MRHSKKEKKKIKEADRSSLSNYLHALAIVLLLVYTIHGIYLESGISSGNIAKDIVAGFSTTGITEIFTFIGAVAFILFGIVGIYEYSYANGIRFLYPKVYGMLREQRSEKTAEIMMKTYYENDKVFLQEYEQQRFGAILNLLGIDSTQFRHLSYDLLRARADPANTIEELREKALLIARQPEYIEDLTQEKNRVYSNADYFLNLYTAVYDDAIKTELGRIMTRFIQLTIENKIKEKSIDYIIVPPGSNLLMGLEVGKRLGIPVIYIQEKARILTDRSWDGKYNYNPREKNQVIILHDILVSGEKIMAVAKTLPKGSYSVLGLFCFAKHVSRFHNPEQKIRSFVNSSDIHYLLSITDSELEECIKQKK